MQQKNKENLNKIYENLAMFSISLLYTSLHHYVVSCDHHSTASYKIIHSCMYFSLILFHTLIVIFHSLYYPMSAFLDSIILSSLQHLFGHHISYSKFIGKNHPSYDKFRCNS